MSLPDFQEVPEGIRMNLRINHSVDGYREARSIKLNAVGIAGNGQELAELEFDVLKPVTMGATGIEPVTFRV
jgi:hypothetical protein